MLENILNFEGVQVLKKTEQNMLVGGKKQCNTHGQCGPGNCCNTYGWCQRFGAHVSTGALCDGPLI